MIAGSYADLKIIRTRQVVQMIVEVPIEEGERLIQVFGLPAPGTEIRVAVARLVAGPLDVQNGQSEAISDAAASISNDLAATSSPGPNAVKSERSRLAYTNASDAGKAVVRCAILCDDPRFGEWLGTVDAAQWVRDHLGIVSRKEIATNPHALKRFLTLEYDYQVATGQAPDPR